MSLWQMRKQIQQPVVSIVRETKKTSRRKKSQTDDDKSTEIMLQRPIEYIEALKQKKSTTNTVFEGHNRNRVLKKEKRQKSEGEE